MFTDQVQLTKTLRFGPKPSRAKRLTLGVLLSFVLSFAGCIRQQIGNSTEPTPVLSKPPNTTYPMPPLKGNIAELGWVLTDGSNAIEHTMHRAKIADYRGKILVLDFYATWCEPCRASIPNLLALQQQFEKQGFQVVGLNVGGPDDRLRVTDFARELNITYPLGFPDRDLIDLLLSDDDAIPQTFVVDRQGLVIKRFIGYEESAAKELEQTIRGEISKGRP